MTVRASIIFCIFLSVTLRAGNAQTITPATTDPTLEEKIEEYPPPPVMENGRRILPNGLEIIPAKPLIPTEPNKPATAIPPSAPEIDVPKVIIPAVKIPTEPRVEAPDAAAAPKIPAPTAPAVSPQAQEVPPQNAVVQPEAAPQEKDAPPKPIAVPFSTITKSPALPLTGRPPGYSPKIDALTGEEINKPPGAAPLITPVHDAITGRQLNADPKTKPYQSPVIDAISGQQLNAAQNEKNGYAPYVPVKRDAITNKKVDTIVGSNPAPQKEQEPSLRDRVRSKLKEDR